MALYLPSRWTRQPQGAVEVDYGNPVADKLCGLVLPTQGMAGFDVVSKSFGTPHYDFWTGQRSVGPNGFKFSHGATGDEWRWPTPGQIANNGDMSIAWVFWLHALPAGTLHLGLSNENSWNNESMPTLLIDSSGGFDVRYASDTSERHLTGTYNGRRHVVVWTWNSVEMVARMYVNGALADTSSTETSDRWAYTKPTVMSSRGFGSNALTGPEIEHQGFAVWARTLSGGEAQELWDNPWQVIRERQPLIISIAAGGTTYTLNAEAGSYTLTGSAAGLLSTRKLDAASGSYTLTGADATLARRLLLNAEAGSYALTGSDATLAPSRLLNAEAGSYAITGADAELVKTGSYALDAQAGSYTVAGADASLLVTRKVHAEAGSYELSGADAGLAVTRLLNAEAGSYIVTGADAELARAGVYTLDAEAGSYGITGADVVFLAPRRGSPAGRSTRGKRRRVVIGERVYEVLERDIPALLEAEILDRAPPATAEHVAGPKPPQKRRRKAAEPVKTVEQVRQAVEQIKERIEPDSWLMQALEAAARRVIERLEDEDEALMLLLAA